MKRKVSKYIGSLLTIFSLCNFSVIATISLNPNFLNSSQMFSTLGTCYVDASEFSEFNNLTATQAKDIVNKQFILNNIEKFLKEKDFNKDDFVGENLLTEKDIDWLPSDNLLLGTTTLQVSFVLKKYYNSDHNVISGTWNVTTHIRNFSNTITTHKPTTSVEKVNCNTFPSLVGLTSSQAQRRIDKKFIAQNIGYFINKQDLEITESDIIECSSVVAFPDLKVKFKLKKYYDKNGDFIDNPQSPLWVNTTITHLSIEPNHKPTKPIANIDVSVFPEFKNLTASEAKQYITNNFIYNNIDNFINVDNLNIKESNISNLKLEVINTSVKVNFELSTYYDEFGDHVQDGYYDYLEDRTQEGKLNTLNITTSIDNFRSTHSPTIPIEKIDASSFLEFNGLTSHLAQRLINEQFIAKNIDKFINKSDLEITESNISNLKVEAFPTSLLVSFSLDKYYDSNGELASQGNFLYIKTTINNFNSEPTTPHQPTKPVASVDASLFTEFKDLTASSAKNLINEQFIADNIDKFINKDDLEIFASNIINLNVSVSVSSTSLDIHFQLDKYYDSNGELVHGKYLDVNTSINNFNSEPTTPHQPTKPVASVDASVFSEFKNLNPSQAMNKINEQFIANNIDKFINKSDLEIFASNILNLNVSISSSNSLKVNFQLNKYYDEHGTLVENKVLNINVSINNFKVYHQPTKPVASTIDASAFPEFKNLTASSAKKLINEQFIANNIDKFINKSDLEIFASNILNLNVSVSTSTPTSLNVHFQLNKYYDEYGNLIQSPYLNINVSINNFSHNPTSQSINDLSYSDFPEFEDLTASSAKSLIDEQFIANNIDKFINKDDLSISASNISKLSVTESSTTTLKISFNLNKYYDDNGTLVDGGKPLVINFSISEFPLNNLGSGSLKSWHWILIAIGIIILIIILVIIIIFILKRKKQKTLGHENDNISSTDEFHSTNSLPFNPADQNLNYYQNNNDYQCNDNDNSYLPINEQINVPENNYHDLNDRALTYNNDSMNTMPMRPRKIIVIGMSNLGNRDHNYGSTSINLRPIRVRR